MSRNSPKSKMEAFVYQWKDQLKLLKSLALMDQQDEFKKQLSVLESQIQIYKQQTGK